MRKCSCIGIICRKLKLCRIISNIYVIPVVSVSKMCNIDVIAELIVIICAKINKGINFFFV